MEETIGLRENPNIKTIRLMYLLEDSSEKEVIKEFFRFIGCIVYDSPVRSQKDLDKVIKEDPWHDVDIVINLNQLTNGIPTERTKRVFLTSDLDNLEWEVSDVSEEVSHAQTKKEFHRRVIECLIDNIWDEQINQQNSVKKINELFFENNLFSYLQMKRAFRVINMGEVLGDRLGSNLIPVDDTIISEYIGKMLNSLWAIYIALKTENEQHDQSTVYSIYASVNAARKIREIFKALHGIPKEKSEAVVSVEAETLLNMLSEVYEKDPDYYGVFFLSAYVCQSDFSLSIRAGDYYNKVLEKCQNTQFFRGFVEYALGSYYEKVWKNRAKAYQLYESAAKKDPECYQARFKLGCYKYNENCYVEAIDYFQESLEIIISDTEFSWENIPLKRVQYIFKIYFWMAQIAQRMGNNGKMIDNLQRAKVAAEIFKSNLSLRKVLDPEDAEVVQKYHEKSTATQLLLRLIKEREDILGIHA